MKTAYIIDQLASGGCERQLSELAIGMKARGHEVEVYCYYGRAFYDNYIENNGIKIVRSQGMNNYDKVINLRRWLNSYAPDIVHCFKLRVSVVGVLAMMLKRKPKLVAVDWFDATSSRHKPAILISLFLMNWADWIITETETNKGNIIKYAPWLRKRTSIIRNGVDIGRFKPLYRPQNDIFQFINVASVSLRKNPERTIEAINILKSLTKIPFHLNWFGNYKIKEASDDVNMCYQNALRLIKKYDLQANVTFRGEIENIQHEYQKADALIIASLTEGIPNVFCEAMACGLPVVVSRVSDLPIIVEKGEIGFTCNPNEPQSIAESLKMMLELREDERQKMGQRSRQLAIDMFNKERYIFDYEKLYNQLLAQHE